MKKIDSLVITVFPIIKPSKGSMNLPFSDISNNSWISPLFSYCSYVVKIQLNLVPSLD